MARRAVIIVVAIVVGSYYLWSVRVAGTEFQWRYDLGGYYNYLARGFARGQLHVPIEPAAELLAQPNPWDPAVNEDFKMHDMALFNGRYYLYHGAGPAVLLFTPWRLIVGHDLPENFALFLLCFGGFLFLSGALLRILALTSANPPPLLLVVMLVALGLCQSVPYLLSRVWVYEVAIGGGYFCVSAAMFFLAKSIGSHRSAGWLAAAGFMFGLAIACRPHLGLAAAVALCGLAIPFTGLCRRQSLAFLIPFALVGAAIAAYNYQRFGNPLEFGVRYLLTGAGQNQIHFAFRNLLPGLYFMLLCPPAFGPVFPWARLILRYPFDSVDWPFPSDYFIEPTAGALYVAPLILGALLVPSLGKSLAQVRNLLWTASASSVAILLFICSTGFTTQRYMVDFLPLAVFAAVAGSGIHVARSTGRRRTAFIAIFVIAVGYSSVVNLAFGIAGPYDEMLKHQPATYLRIARWFSPIGQFRPILKPSISVDLTVEFTPHLEGFREPLITFAGPGYSHLIYVEHPPGRLNFISQSAASKINRDIPDPGLKPIHLRVTYSPESGKLTTSVNGEDLLVHDVGTLMVAPSQILVGENPVHLLKTVRKFSGRIYDVVRVVGER